jgi:hypothetical protein
MASTVLVPRLSKATAMFTVIANAVLAIALEAFSFVILSLQPS